MIRRLAFLCLLALASVSLGGVAFFTPPPLIAAKPLPCSDTTKHTVTATGANSTIVPSGCTYFSAGT